MKQLTEMKILLIDDDEGIRTALSHLLKSRCRDLRVVETAEAGLECLREESWDVVLSDYELPGMSGMELLEICTREYPGTTGILMTGYSGAELETRVKESGICCLVRKPLSTANLLNCLERFHEKPCGAQE